MDILTDPDVKEEELAKFINLKVVADKHPDLLKAFHVRSVEWDDIFPKLLTLFTPLREDLKSTEEHFGLRED